MGMGQKCLCKYLALALPNLAYYMHVMGLGLLLFYLFYTGRESVWSKDLQRLLWKAFDFHKEGKFTHS